MQSGEIKQTRCNRGRLFDHDQLVSPCTHTRAAALAAKTPSHITLLFEAAIVSRMRSPMPSRSNLARTTERSGSSAPSGRRCVKLLVVRKNTISENKDAPSLEDLESWQNRRSERVHAVDLVTTTVRPPRDSSSPSASEPPVHRSRRETPAASITSPHRTQPSLRAR